MRPTTIILTALLLAAPMASAGGAGADATYLESHSDCREWEHESHYWESESYHNHTGNTSYGWGESTWWYNHSAGEACSGHTTYANATASDDQGALAHASATGSNWSSESHEHSGDGEGWWSYWYDSNSSDYYYYDEEREDYSGSHARSEGWSRDASAWTTAGSADVSRGCASSSDSSYDGKSSSWQSDDGRSYRDARWTQQHSEDGCHTTATADHADRTASAGHVDGCTYDSDRFSETEYGSEGNTSWRSWESNGEYSSQCRNGAEADAAGASAFAGAEQTCTGQNAYDYYQSDSGDRNESYESWDSWGRSDCFYGYVVEGPTDANARAGWEHQSDYYCQESSASGENETREECDEWSSDNLVVGAAWASNPLGPTDVGFAFPLP